MLMRIRVKRAQRKRAPRGHSADTANRRSGILKATLRWAPAPLFEARSLQGVRVVAQCGSVGFSGTAVCRRNAGSRATGYALAAQEVRYCRFILGWAHGGSHGVCAAAVPGLALRIRTKKQKRAPVSLKFVLKT